MPALRIATQATSSAVFPVLLVAKYVLIRDPDADLNICYEAGPSLQGTSSSITWNVTDTLTCSDDDVLPAMKSMFVSLQHGRNEVCIASILSLALTAID